MQLKNILREMGLKNEDAEIYLATLELGSASAYTIAKKSNIARSSCYEILERLQEQNFISVFRKKKTKYYSAEDPKKIMTHFQEKIDSFRLALPEFNALYGESRLKPTVRFYSGTSGMKIIFEEILDEARKFISFGSVDDIFNSLGKDYWNKFVEKRIRKKIVAKNILFDTPQAQERKKIAQKQLREVCIIPQFYNHHSTTIIWNNKIAMFSFKDEMVALVIESKELAQAQKMMMNYIWKVNENK